MNTRALLTALAITLLGLSQAHAYDSTITNAYTYYSLSVPTPTSVLICHGFGCDRRTLIALGKGDHAKLTALLGPGRASPEAERRAIVAAVAWFDRRVGPEAGTTGRIARASAFTQSGPGQMDCIDTSRNTTSLLLILDQLKLLRHHQVEAPVARGVILPHATAVLRESKNGQRWAVDPWTKKYGENPDMKPLEQWRSEGTI
jgi:hypothetical protein